MCRQCSLLLSTISYLYFMTTVLVWHPHSWKTLLCIWQPKFPSWLPFLCARDQIDLIGLDGRLGYLHILGRHNVPNICVHAQVDNLHIRLDQWEGLWAGGFPPAHRLKSRTAGWKSHMKRLKWFTCIPSDLLRNLKTCKYLSNNGLTLIRKWSWMTRPSLLSVVAIFLALAFFIGHILFTFIYRYITRHTCKND